MMLRAGQVPATEGGIMSEKGNNGADARSRRDPAFIARMGRNLGSQATRSIELLDAIDCTLDALRADVELMSPAVEAFRRVAAALRDAPLDSPVADPEGKGARGIRAGLEGVERMHAALAARHEAALRDPRLCDDDGVVAAYQEAMAVCRDLYDATYDAEEAFLEAVADHEAPGGETYTSAEALIAALRA